MSQIDFRDHFNYIPETGELFWKKGHPKASKSRPGMLAGSRRVDGYLRVSLFGQDYLSHRVIFFMMEGRLPEFIDHKNRDKSDNRWRNLREVTKRQNNVNTGLRKNNASGFKGVYFHKSRNKWMARISIEGRSKFLGYTNSPQEAAALYDKAVDVYHEGCGWKNGK